MTEQTMNGNIPGMANADFWTFYFWTPLPDIAYPGEQMQMCKIGKLSSMFIHYIELWYKIKFWINKFIWNIVLRVKFIYLFVLEK